MALLNKTEAGVVGAYRIDDGIAVGPVKGPKGGRKVYGIAYLVNRGGKLVLELCNTTLKENGIEVVNI